MGFLQYFQVGDDKTVKQWKMESPEYGEEEEPIHTILGKVVNLSFDFPTPLLFN